jgi:hypothetical protein
MNHYPVGSLVTVTGTFTDKTTSAPVDPATVTIQAWIERGPIPSAPSVTKVSTGVYTADLDTTDLSGDWTYRFFGTGGAQAAAVGQFIVDGIPT